MCAVGEEGTMCLHALMQVYVCVGNSSSSSIDGRVSDQFHD